MSKKQQQGFDHSSKQDGEDVAPSSLTELEPIVKEFMEKYNTIKAEQETLKQDEKELLEEYSSKIDMKTLKLAMRVTAIREKVERKDTFDSLVEVLERL